LPFGDIHIDTEAVDVIHENRIPVDTPVLVTKVKHRSGMGVSAACSSRTEVSGMGSPSSQPMHVISDRLDIVIGIWVEVLSSLPLIPCPLYDMEQVRNHTYR